MHNINMQSEFSNWLDFIFDHEVDNYKPIWYQAPGFYEDLTGKEEQALAFLTKLFTEANQWLLKYADDQVGLGLWYLLDQACSDYARLLEKPEISTELKQTFLLSINELFQE